MFGHGKYLYARPDAKRGWLASTDHNLQNTPFAGNSTPKWLDLDKICMPGLMWVGCNVCTGSFKILHSFVTQHPSVWTLRDCMPGPMPRYSACWQINTQIVGPR